MNSHQNYISNSFDFKYFYSDNAAASEYCTEYGTFGTDTGKYQSFCEICDQHFRTQVILNRHKKTRKHARKFIRTKMDKKRCETGDSLSLLPDEIIDSLIHDLADSLDQKDSFFNNIKLDDSNSEPSQSLPSCEQTFNNDSETDNSPAATNSDAQQNVNISNTIPKIHPCSLCFRTLHSQELFDQHLQEKHFHNCA